MPLVYQQNINLHSKLGVWHITEPEDFFLAAVPIHRAITHPNKRLQHLAGRFLLKELFPGFPYELIKIADTRKPFLENEAYHFSISHCGEYAAVLVSTVQRVGVDIEKVTAKVEKVKHKFLSPAEQALINAMGTTEEQNRLFLTAAWSIKESLFKWYGDGEVDFIEHLQIDSIDFENGTGLALCKVSKQNEIPLPVYFLLLKENCLSWVSSEIIPGR